MNKGEIYGYWTILKEVERHIYPSGKKRRQFECKCSCGTIKNILINTLKNGESKSCGCYNIEKIKERTIKHGMTGTRIYNIWLGIKSRCDNKKDTGYKHYGLRGITYDKRWSRFEEFYKDMGPTYIAGLTIDRKNNMLNYCKSNCRWISSKEQCLNKRSNILYNGKCLSEWCNELGLNYSTVNSRINRYGWSIKDALQ